MYKTTKLNQEQHKKIKILAAENNVPIQEMLNFIVAVGIESSKNLPKPTKAVQA